MLSAYPYPCWVSGGHIALDPTCVLILHTCRTKCEESKLNEGRRLTLYRPCIQSLRMVGFQEDTSSTPSHCVALQSLLFLHCCHTGAVAEHQLPPCDIPAAQHFLWQLRFNLPQLAVLPFFTATVSSSSPPPSPSGVNLLLPRTRPDCCVSFALPFLQDLSDSRNLR